MQQVVVAKPYTFVPPRRGTLWPTLLRALALRRILHGYGVVEVECRGVARLRASIDARHGIVLAPNHCHLAGTPPPERIVEMAEKLEEDLTDDVRRISPFRAIVDVGEPIEVPPDRARGANGDGIMSAVRSGIQRMLAASLAERWPGTAMGDD